MHENWFSVKTGFEPLGNHFIKINLFMTTMVWSINENHIVGWFTWLG
jgi:hypothetical protein